MTDTNLPLSADTDFDDLPRTFRRERERQAEERQAASSATAASAPAAPFDVAPSGYDAGNYGVEPTPATVERFDVPFFHLMAFLLKAVVAAIPALFLLAIILWFAGQALQAFFPELVQMKILISFPGEPAP